MQKKITKFAGDIVDLMERSERVLGLELCFHRRLDGISIPDRFCQHSHHACLKNKKDNSDLCIRFDALEVHREIAGNQAGRIHRCPFGLTELAVPVYCLADFAGVLFAGPCRRPADIQLSPSLRLFERQELLDRLLLLRAIAGELSRIIEGELALPDNDRQRQIMRFIRDRLDRQVKLDELAHEMNLSNSRCGHVVMEIFSKSLPELANRIKMQEAAHLLRVTDLPIGEVAARFGFLEQSYFSRVFRQCKGFTPREFRRKSNPEA